MKKAIMMAIAMVLILISFTNTASAKTIDVTNGGTTFIQTGETWILKWQDKTLTFQALEDQVGISIFVGDFAIQEMHFSPLTSEWTPTITQPFLYRKVAGGIEVINDAFDDPYQRNCIIMIHDGWEKVVMIMHNNQPEYSNLVQRLREKGFHITPWHPTELDYFQESKNAAMIKFGEVGNCFRGVLAIGNKATRSRLGREDFTILRFIDNPRWLDNLVAYIEKLTN